MQDEYHSSITGGGPIAIAIRRLGRADHFSLELLAQKTGIPQAHLAAIEGGTARPTYTEVWRLAQALQIEEQALLRHLGFRTYYRQPRHL